METKEKCRLELVSLRLIKRMPGLSIGVSQKGIGKARDISRNRGYYKPVVLSDAQGCMTLLAGAAAFEASLEDKASKIPAVIVQTEGEADDLLFALQAVELEEPPNAVAVSAAIVRLIDAYSVTRKHIAEALGKSPAWINRMESLSRKLNATVRKMVTEGQVSQRSAQDIARLPDDVQLSFAISIANEFLSKENVRYLVSRYLNEDTCPEERDRIIRTPKLALPNECKGRGRMSNDISDSVRLARAIARCMDDASYLSGLLVKSDISNVAVRLSDVKMLSDILTALNQQVQAAFCPGKNAGGA